MLVSDILTISKLEGGKMNFMMEPFDINAVLHAAKNWNGQASAKGLMLEIIPEENLPKVIGDRLRLEQVLGILLNNAVAFTDKGGITVRAHRTIFNTIEISVADTGTGIAPEDIGKLFTKFFQADASRSRMHGGSGLGLAITKGIIEVHGGQIRAESEVGKGSTFTFSLPVMNGRKQKGANA